MTNSYLYEKSKPKELSCYFLNKDSQEIEESVKKNVTKESLPLDCFQDELNPKVLYQYWRQA